MGIFQSIYNMGPRGRHLRKKKFGLMRKQAENQISSALEAQQTDIEESARGRAFLGQALAGRGLSKSSIAQQDTERYDRLADRRKAAMQRRVDLAYANKKYVTRAIEYERKSVYPQLLDGILSIAAGAGGGGGGNIGAPPEQGHMGTGYSSYDYYGYTPGQG